MLWDVQGFEACRVMEGRFHEARIKVCFIKEKGDENKDVQSLIAGCAMSLLVVHFCRESNKEHSHFIPLKEICGQLRVLTYIDTVWRCFGEFRERESDF